jgi:integrase
MVLHAYLADARRRGTVSRNPASNVRLESGRARRPLVWTAERIAYWRRTGRRPSPSMVWTPEQAGPFLDAVAEDRLYPLFHLVAYRALRRSEVIGLAWADVDLDVGVCHIRETVVDLGDLDVDYEEWDETKTVAGDRIISLDALNVAVLLAWRARQDEERARWGDTWIDSGRIFTEKNGEPLNPESLSQHFDRAVARLSRTTVRCTATTRGGGQCRRLAVVLVDGRPRCELKLHSRNGSQLPAERSELPPIRFHDLRHTAASLTYRVTRDLKLVSELLGHSTIKITGDIYTSVFAEVDRAAAACAHRAHIRGGRELASGSRRRNRR